MPAYIHKLFGLSAAALLFTASCQQRTNSEGEDTDNRAPATQPIVLASVSPSPEFPGASLSLASATATPQGNDSVKVAFSFDVKNYELKHQTEDAANKGCNNSAQGQHIHFIMDNTPYVALYEPKHETVLPRNSEHYLLCFLSRSYHESLKNKEAAFMLHFRIDENGKFQRMDDPGTPMVFYSRPKGDYVGADTTNLLLDYYVWNAGLGDTYQVQAKIKNPNIPGKDTTLNLTEWKPYFIQNLGTGRSEITLTLTDANNQPVSGPMTQVSRQFTLAAQEPLQR